MSSAEHWHCQQSKSSATIYKKELDPNLLFSTHKHAYRSRTFTVITASCHWLRFIIRHLRSGTEDVISADNTTEIATCFFEYAQKKKTLLCTDDGTSSSHTSSRSSNIFSSRIVKITTNSPLFFILPRSRTVALINRRNRMTREYRIACPQWPRRRITCSLSKIWQWTRYLCKNTPSADEKRSTMLSSNSWH